MGHRDNLIEFPRLPELQCAACGSQNVRTTIETETFAYGESTARAELTARIPVRICDACGFHFTDEAADDARHEAICRHLRVMTPQEIATVRKTYGLSRAEFARLTRLGEASLARWEAGLLIQNAAYDRFLYLLTFRENIERLKQEDHQSVVKTIARRIVERPQMNPGLRSLREISPDLRARAAAFQLCPTGTY